MRLRYYDPAAGRFVSRGPLGLWGDRSQSGSGQGYCGHNPVNLTDPLGLDGEVLRPASEWEELNLLNLWDWVKPGGYLVDKLTDLAGKILDETDEMGEGVAADPAEAAKAIVEEGALAAAEEVPPVDLVISAAEVCTSDEPAKEAALQAGSLIVPGGDALRRLKRLKKRLQALRRLKKMRKGPANVDDTIKGLDDSIKAGEDAVADPEFLEEAGEQGVIYRVPGSGTPSGKPYIGSADDLEKRAKTARDGRDRSRAEVIDTYPKGDTEVRRAKGQGGIDGEGGLENTDNKRNEQKKR